MVGGAPSRVRQLNAGNGPHQLGSRLLYIRKHLLCLTVLQRPVVLEIGLVSKMRLERLRVDVHRLSREVADLPLQTKTRWHPW